MTTLPSERQRVRIALELDLVMDIETTSPLGDILATLEAVLAGSTALEAINAGLEGSSLADPIDAEALTLAYDAVDLDGAPAPRIVSREYEEVYP